MGSRWQRTKQGAARIGKYNLSKWATPSNAPTSTICLLSTQSLFPTISLLRLLVVFPLIACEILFGPDLWLSLGRVRFVPVSGAESAAQAVAHLGRCARCTVFGAGTERRVERLRRLLAAENAETAVELRAVPRQRREGQPVEPRTRINRYLGVFLVFVWFLLFVFLSFFFGGEYFFCCLVFV